MLAQQLAHQAPCRQCCFKVPAWRVPQPASSLRTVSQASQLVSVGASSARKRGQAASPLTVIDSLSPTLQKVTQNTGSSNQFLDLYILGKHIGSGAYGQVQLVIERTSGRCAAVKLLPKLRGKLSKEKTMKKIRKEIELMGSIQECGNVIRLHGVYEDDAQVYVVMELCSGGDLERVLEEHGTFNELQTALVLYECLKVIASCHAKCIVHGDVKPANFMLQQRFREPLRSLEHGAVQGSWLKAVDFGCSQSYRNKTQLSRRTGTPVYMAPEVFKRDYLEASDMWSLGMMMYQLLTGRFPFWDTLEQCRAHGIDEVMRAVIMDPIPINYGPWLNMSAEGISFLKGLMLRDPAQRMSAADALEHPWFTEQFEASEHWSRQQTVHSDAHQERAAEQRNNIVPLHQQQHQSQSQHSSDLADVHASKPYAMSM